MKISQYEFLPKKDVLDRYNTDLEGLGKIASEQGKSIEELIIPKSIFKESKNDIIDKYNKFWYLMEKGLSTCLSIFEEKNLYMTYIDSRSNIRIDDEDFKGGYIDSFSRYLKYIKGFKNSNIEKKLYYLKTHIVFYDYIYIILNYGLNDDTIKYISEFDKTILLTCMYGCATYDYEIELLIKKGVKRIRIDKELGFNSDLQHNYEVLIEYLKTIDYKLFNDLLIDVEVITNGRFF